MDQERERDELHEKLANIRQDMLTRAERWQSAHNHKESVAYLTLTASAVLFLHLLSENWPLWQVFLAGIGLIASHWFMRQELIERRRIAFLIATADAVANKIAFEPETISPGDIRIGPAPELYDRLPRNLHRIWLHIVPTNYVDYDQLQQMAQSTLTRSLLEKQVCHVRKMRRDLLPSLASLAIVISGLIVVVDRVVRFLCKVAALGT